MNIRTLQGTSIIAVVAIASIAMIISLSQTEDSTAQTVTGNNVYVFAEGVSPQATFEFREKTVTYDFQIYTQTNNLFTSIGNFQTPKQTSPEFSLTKIVGETSYLHEAVDQSYERGGRGTPFEYPYRLFDVKVDLVQAGQPVRSFEYTDCSISNYKVITDFDKEEGYTSGGRAGFAVTETYNFVCTGYDPSSTYDNLEDKL